MVDIMKEIWQQKDTDRYKKTTSTINHIASARKWKFITAYMPECKCAKVIHLGGQLWMKETWSLSVLLTGALKQLQ